MKSKRQKKLPPEIFCPVRQTIKILGKRWTILIIKEIYYSKGKKLSFMNLRRRLVNVSAKVLSGRLKEMADDGLIKRRVHADETPVKVNYSLTKKGRDTCKIIEDMKEYGQKWGGAETFDCTDRDCELCAEMRDSRQVP